MSDGEAKLPINAINLFTNDRTFKDMIKFYSVGYGSGADSKLMTEIAEQMPNGMTKMAPDAEAIGDFFVTILLNELQN